MTKLNVPEAEERARAIAANPFVESPIADSFLALANLARRLATGLKGHSGFYDAKLLEDAEAAGLLEEPKP